MEINQVLNNKNNNNNNNSNDETKENDKVKDEEKQKDKDKEQEKDKDKDKADESKENANNTKDNVESKENTNLKIDKDKSKKTAEEEEEEEEDFDVTTEMKQQKQQKEKEKEKAKETEKESKSNENSNDNKEKEKEKPKNNERKDNETNEKKEKNESKDNKDNDNGNSKNENDKFISIEDEIAREFSERNNNRKIQWIRAPHGLVMLHIMDKRINTVEFINYVFSQTYPNKPDLSPFLFRLYPLETTCMPQHNDIVNMCEKLILKYFTNDIIPYGTKYYINYKNRSNKQLNRQKLMNDIGALVPKEHYSVKIGDEAQAVILLQTCVVKQFFGCLLLLLLFVVVGGGVVIFLGRIVFVYNNILKVVRFFGVFMMFMMDKPTGYGWCKCIQKWNFYKI